MATSAFQYVSGRLPGASRATSPTDVVNSYKNQGLGGLIAGTSAQVGAIREPGTSALGEETTESSITLDRRTASVRTNSQRLMVSAQAMGNRRRQEEAKRQAEAVAQRARASQQASTQVAQTSAYRPPGGSKKFQPQPQGQSSSGRGKSGFVVGQSGSRIENLLTSFPGLRITETLGNRDRDRKNGVPRRAQSFHYDSKNPAVDIGGSTAQLDALYRELVRQGGWRQILWRVKGHYDHIHVA